MLWKTKDHECSSFSHSSQGLSCWVLECCFLSTVSHYRSHSFTFSPNHLLFISRSFVWNTLLQSVKDSLKYTLTIYPTLWLTCTSASIERLIELCTYYPYDLVSRQSNRRIQETEPKFIVSPLSLFLVRQLDDISSRSFWDCCWGKEGSFMARNGQDEILNFQTFLNNAHCFLPDHYLRSR